MPRRSALTGAVGREGVAAVVSQGALDQSATPWRWSVGTLAAGASATLTVNATTAAGLGGTQR